MISTEMNVDISNQVVVKDEPVCQEYTLTSEIKTKRVKQEPIDNIEIQKSDSIENESTSKKIKQEVEEEETTQTISIAFLNETTTTLSETTTNEKRNKLEKSTK